MLYGGKRIEFLSEGPRINDLMHLLQTNPAKESVSAKAPTGKVYNSLFHLMNVAEY